MAYYSGVLGNAQALSQGNYGSLAQGGRAIPQSSNSIAAGPAYGGAFSMPSQQVGIAPNPMGYGDLPDWAQQLYGQQMQGFDPGVQPYQQNRYFNDYMGLRQSFAGNSNLVDPTTGVFTPWAYQNGRMDPTKYNALNGSFLKQSDGPYWNKLLNPVTGAQVGSSDPSGMPWTQWNPQVGGYGPGASGQTVNGATGRSVGAPTYDFSGFSKGIRF